MKCEVFVKEYLPAIKAILAKLLFSNYSLKQEEIARRLGISQTLVSMYLSGERGIKAEEIEEKRESMEIVDRIAREIANGKFLEDLQDELCLICRGCFA